MLLYFELCQTTNSPTRLNYAIKLYPRCRATSQLGIEFFHCSVGRL